VDVGIVCTYHSIVLGNGILCFPGPARRQGCVRVVVIVVVGDVAYAKSRASTIHR
jgi:hypothetical protein